MNCNIPPYILHCLSLTITTYPAVTTVTDLHTRSCDVHGVPHQAGRDGEQVAQGVKEQNMKQEITQKIQVKIKSRHVYLNQAVIMLSVCIFITPKFFLKFHIPYSIFHYHLQSSG